MTTTLNNLSTEEFLISLGAISSSDSLYRALKKSETVRRISKELIVGSVSKEQAEDYLNTLFRGFESGKYFLYEYSIAGLCVAASFGKSQFADRFIDRLMSAHIPEMPYLQGVARICHKQYSQLAALDQIEHVCTETGSYSQQIFDNQIAFVFTGKLISRLDTGEALCPAG